MIDSDFASLAMNMLTVAVLVVLVAVVVLAGDRRRNR